jgi:integrase
MRRRPRGSGTIIRKGSGWAIRYGPRGRQVYESGFRTRAEAENRLTLLRAEAMQRRIGAAADPRLSPRLGDLATPWLERRKGTHAAHAEDKSRWKCHLEPAFGRLRPDEIGTAALRAFIETKRAELEPGTVRGLIAVLSSLYEDLLERGLARANPCRALPRSVRRLMRPTHDPRTTPFVERLDDVRRIYLALREASETIGAAYAIGALAGLRTSEVLYLRWPSVDLAGRRIVVSEARRGGTKDHEPRPVPILDPLLPVLTEWRLTHPGTGLVCPPLTAKGRHIWRLTPGNMLRAALNDLGLARVGFGLEPEEGEEREKEDLWYRCTRHSFASHWAMAGGSLRELQAILGHSSIAVTERYAHLAPGWVSAEAHSLLRVSLAPGSGTVAHLDTPTDPGTEPNRAPSQADSR